MKRGVWIYLGVSVSLSVLVSVAYALFFRKPPTVRDTIASIRSALEERDAKRFGRYVDVDSICSSLAVQAGKDVWGDDAPPEDVAAASRREVGLSLGRSVCAMAAVDAITNGSLLRFNATVGSVERVGDATIAAVTVEDGKSADKTDVLLRLRIDGSSWRVVEVGNLRTLLDNAHRVDKEAAAR